MRGLLFTQVSRAIREFTPEQLEFLANIVRLFRGEAGSRALVAERFPNLAYADIAGLCKVATLAEIVAQGWSLNPGRYVGVGARAPDEFVFAERLEELNEELEALKAEALALEEQVAANVAELLAV
jgi:type I restriction enzyme M protein